MMCFRKLPVAKKIMDKRGGEGYQDFPSKNFCLTMPKTFAKEPFVLCFRRLLIAKNPMDNRLVSKFSVEKLWI